VTYIWAELFSDESRQRMNSSNSPANDSAFPAGFVILSTFIGALVWLCVMLASLQQP
jgi:hypothetical protein